MADLNLLVEKMDLCDSMLKRGAGEPALSVGNDETLLSLIGFVEACAPRLVELVEAGAQGALSEPVLMKCLDVNDRLTRLFNGVDATALPETPASTTESLAPSPYSAAPFEDLLLDSNQGDLHQGTKTSGQEQDPLGSFQVSRGGLAANEAEIKKTNSDDEFDSFFNERTGGS